MHVLLVNDDGIMAPGIRALGETFKAAGYRVSVCAPDRQRSAASHSVTLGGALRAKAMEFEWADAAWAADGTPADCASLGIHLTRENPVDLVISGINRGMNMGGACVYSGTVAAALEAAMCGTQGMAVSLCVNPGDAEDYAAAARVALRVAEWALSHPLPLGAMYNLNVPPIPYEQIRGIVPATLAPIFLDAPDYVKEYEDADGVHYRYRGIPRPYSDPRYDTARVERGFAALTKLTWDFRLNADDAELGQIEL